MKRRVGIPMSVYGSVCGVGASYYGYITEMFEEVEIVMLPPSHIIQDLDLLLLPGGADVECQRYGKIPTVSQGKPNVFYEHFDKVYLPAYIRAKVPIFGICRGMQTLNVTFGGSLSEVYHKTNPPDAPGKEMHDVFANHSPEATVVSDPFKLKHKFSTNSRHHQGVDPEDLADGFIPLYLDSNTPSKVSCIEAFMHESLPIVGVQWHPEDLLDQFSIDIIDYLLDLKANEETNKISSKSALEES